MVSRFLAFFCFVLTAIAQPQRIVSTAPSITELLYALGLGDRVVGVTTFCNYPPEARRKPKIGSYTEPNLEAIAALRPDLVIVQTNPVRLSERLRLMKLRVLEIDQQNLAALYHSFHQVGQATGGALAAAKLADSLRKGMEGIRVRAAKSKPVRMAFVVGRSPGRLDGLIVAGKASYLSEILSIAGGENIFADAVAAYPAVSMEEMMARNPEVILDMGDMSSDIGVTAAQKQAVVDLWSRIPTIRAVNKRRVFAVSASSYVVPGPRALDAAREMFALLHPELQ